MQIDWLMTILFFVGVSVQLFYKPDKALEWIKEKLKGTIFYPDNKAKQMGLQMILFPISYLGFFVKFGIVGFIVFKAYDVVGFEKTILLTIIMVYLALTSSSSNKNI